MPLLYPLRQNPVIAAVKDNISLQLAIDSERQFISVLYSSIYAISNIVEKIKNTRKYAFIRTDLLGDASNKEVVIQFLRPVTEADGIISTKASILKAARAKGLFHIHRLFIVDSVSFHNINKQVAQSNPDCIGTPPGCMPKVLGWVTEKTRQPPVAGGLVCDEEDVRSVINADIVVLSTTNIRVWTLMKRLL